MFTLLSLTLLPLALARPKASSPFQVTNLYTFEPSGRDGVSVYRVEFNVTDPNDSASTSCVATWPYEQRDTGYPRDYLANCTSPAWSFKLNDYQNVWDFVLDVSHESKKKDKRTVRAAKGTVDRESILQCTFSGSGFAICRQRDGVAFPLTVYNTTDCKN